MKEPESTAPEEAPSGPRVTALIVSYNCIDPLRRTLRSLLASHGRELLQIIVVDNASQDGGSRVDQEFEEVTVLRMPHYMGLTRARNIGIRTATGEYLFFLAPGVEVKPETVNALTSALTEHPEALAVCPMLVDENGLPIPQAYRLPDKAALSLFWRGCPLAALPAPDGEDPIPVEYPSWHALLIRRHTIQGVNYLDQRFGEYWADADLCHQIRRASRKILLLPCVQATFRREGVWQPRDTSERAAFTADAALGAAALIGKQEGITAGLWFQIRTILLALGRALWKTLTFSDPAYHWGVFARIIAGQKLDGGTKV